MRRLICAAATVAAIAIGGCGGGDKSPTAPAAAAVPNFAGTWAGNYTITQCSQSGGVALANICGNQGSALPFTIRVTQSPSAVSSTFALGSIEFSGASASLTNGTLNIAAANFSNGINIVATWALTLPTTTQIAGTVSQTWTAPGGLSGQAILQGTIAQPTTHSASARIDVAPAVRPSNLRELIEALQRR